MRLRLLPALILVGSLALAGRLGNLWLGFTSEAAAKSEAQGEAAPTPPADQVAKAEAVPEETGKAAAPARDPLSMSDEEIALLQSLAGRREALEKREAELQQRADLLAAMEKRVDEKLSSLNSLQNDMKNLMKQQGEEEELRLQSLVKIYENMKPREAARIFETLDMPVLLDVIARMKERKTAPILAQMDPNRARAVTLELAQLRQAKAPM